MGPFFFVSKMIEQNSETRFERDFGLLCTKKRETASLSA